MTCQASDERIQSPFTGNWTFVNMSAPVKMLQRPHAARQGIDCVVSNWHKTGEYSRVFGSCAIAGTLHVLLLDGRLKVGRDAKNDRHLHPLPRAAITTKHGASPYLCQIFGI